MALNLIKAPIGYGVRRVIDYRLRTDTNRMLFIVGHMRSGSSLLVHLLASSPHILGFGEAHERHESLSDFSRVAWKILRSFGRVWPRERYFLDKVLHAKYGLSAELLRWSGTRTILLVRQPESTLPSIMKLGLPRFSTESAATDYYVERLAAVESLAGELGPKRCAFVTYEQLVSETEAALRSLTTFLELPEPLKEEYDLLWSTGRFGLGDPSEKIRAGRIMRTESRPATNFGEAYLSRAAEAYRRCVDGCTSLLGSGERTSVGAGASVRSGEPASAPSRVDPVA
jgi:hypothetical protein